MPDKTISKKNKEENKNHPIKLKPMKNGAYRIYVDPELIEVLDSIANKLNDLAYQSFEETDYKKMSRILARKIKENNLA